MSARKPANRARRASPNRANERSASSSCIAWARTRFASRAPSRPRISNTHRDTPRAATLGESRGLLPRAPDREPRLLGLVSRLIARPDVAGIIAAFAVWCRAFPGGNRHCFAHRCPCTRPWHLVPGRESPAWYHGHHDAHSHCLSRGQSSSQTEEHQEPLHGACGKEFSWLFTSCRMVPLAETSTTGHIVATRCRAWCALSMIRTGSLRSPARATLVVEPGPRRSGRPRAGKVDLPIAGNPCGAPNRYTVRRNIGPG